MSVFLLLDFVSVYCYIFFFKEGLPRKGLIINILEKLNFQ